MTMFRTPLSRAALAFALAASTGAFAPAGAYDGKPVARYHLENAWPQAPGNGALADLPGGPKSVAPGPPDGDKALGGPDTMPPADGTRWDFTKNSDFRLSGIKPGRKGPALRAR